MSPFRIMGFNEELDYASMTPGPGSQLTKELSSKLLKNVEERMLILTLMTKIGMR